MIRRPNKTRSANCRHCLETIEAKREGDAVVTRNMDGSIHSCAVSQPEPPEPEATASPLSHLIFAEAALDAFLARHKNRYFPGMPLVLATRRSVRRAIEGLASP